MPVKDYGVWKAFAVTFNFEYNDPNDPTPHLYLYFVDNKDNLDDSRRRYPLPPSDGPFPGRRDGQKPDLFEAAINIKSGFKPNPLLAFWCEKDFEHPITDRLKELESDGFHPLQDPSEKKRDGRALDYIRSNLFQTNTGQLVPHDTPEKGDDIIDILHPLVRDAVEKSATLYIFGSRYGSHGIHEVHMNQGNYKTGNDKWYKENGVFQDGGLLIHYADEHSADNEKWVAVFLAFATQAVHTSDTSGVPIGNETWSDYLPLRNEDSVPSRGVPVLITEALVNPTGPDGQPGTEAETVTLTNATDESISLDSWKITNLHGDFEQISEVNIGAKKSAIIQVPNCPLSNKGDTITLLDPNELKVHGVSYTAAQARQQGESVFFPV